MWASLPGYLAGLLSLGALGGLLVGAPWLTGEIAGLRAQLDADMRHFRVPAFCSSLRARPGQGGMATEGGALAPQRGSKL